MAHVAAAAAAVGVGAVIGAVGKKKEAKGQANMVKAQGAADLEAARVAKASKDNEANQLDYMAGQERATAQRSAREELRKARLLESRAMATAAATGTQGPSFDNLIADISAEGEYRALTALYEGGTRAHTMNWDAVARRYEGNEMLKAGKISSTTSISAAKTIKKAGNYGAAATLIGGLGQAAGMYKSAS